MNKPSVINCVGVIIIVISKVNERNTPVFNVDISYALVNVSIQFYFLVFQFLSKLQSNTPPLKK